MEVLDLLLRGGTQGQADEDRCECEEERLSEPEVPGDSGNRRQPRIGPRNDSTASTSVMCMRWCAL